MKHEILDLDFQQWKIIAYGYAKHLIEKDHSGWKNQWIRFKWMLFCNTCKLLTISLYDSGVSRSYCEKCDRIIQQKDLISLPDYYNMIKGDD